MQGYQLWRINIEIYIIIYMIIYTYIKYLQAGKIFWVTCISLHEDPKSSRSFLSSGCSFREQMIVRMTLMTLAMIMKGTWGHSAFKKDEVLPSTVIDIGAWSGTVKIRRTLMTLAMIMKGTWSGTNSVSISFNKSTFPWATCRKSEVTIIKLQERYAHRFCNWRRSFN